MNQKYSVDIDDVNEHVQRQTLVLSFSGTIQLFSEATDKHALNLQRSSV